MGGIETFEEDAWFDWARATARSAAGVFISKLVAAVLLAQIWLIPMEIRMLWGFLPTTAFFTTPGEFQRLATWSTVLTCAFAIGWMLRGLMRQRGRPASETLGTFTAVPMALLLVGLEWHREIRGEHLIESSWLWRLIAALAAAIVLFAGFWNTEGHRAGELRTPGKNAPSPDVAPPPTPRRRIQQQGATPP